MSTRGLRQDIQGLRALAVSLVVAFHLSATLLPGGYIGVDVFFVISGFLITGHLWREVERSGRIRIIEFWAKRARRLLPAAFLVLLVSAVAVLTVMPATLRSQNLSEIGFSAVYVVNWVLAANSVDYLAADNSPSLAQHYWSLSVEEQFYLVWPILVVVSLWVAARIEVRGTRRALLVALGAVFVISLAFSVWETARSAQSAYFVTTTRAWEFASGGLVALIAGSRLGELSRVAMSWGALIAIVGSALLYDSETMFPGWVALVPVAGTAILLWVGDSSHAWSPQRLAKFRPIQTLGNVSYSVYLWHWPVIIVTTQLLGRPPGWIWGLLILAVTMVLGIVTKRWVEDPIRHAAGVLARPAATFGVMLAGMAAVGLVTVLPQKVASESQRPYTAEVESQLADMDGCFGAYAITNDCANPYAITETVQPVYSQTLEHWSAFDEDPTCSWGEDVHNVRQGDCLLEGAPGAPRVLMLGDSHSAQYLHPMLALAREHGWHFELHSRSLCPGMDVRELKLDLDDPRVAACADWGDELLERAQDLPYDVVITTARPRLYEGQEDAAAERLRQFQTAGARTIVIGGVPGTGDGVSSTGTDAPQCVESAIAAGETNDPCVYEPAPWEDVLELAAAESQSDFVNPREILCSNDGECHIVIGGTIVYQDNNHLSVDFARSMQPWLDERLSSIMEQL